MKRNLTLFLNDIENYSSLILEFVSGLTYEDFSSDKKTILAVTRSLEIIGEAVRHIPNDFRKKYPDIEWKNIAGLRNVITHEYFGIDLPIIWNVIQNKLPYLANRIKEILNEYNSSDSFDLM